MSIKTFAALAALLVAAPLAAQRPISPGQTVRGTLDAGDPQMEDGAWYDAYVIRGRPGERLVVRMTSEDFDTYLHWGYEDRDGDWNEEAENDDSGDGTDSRLVIQLDDDGEYELRAAGFDEDEEGEYELHVSRPGATRPVRIRVGDEVEGELGDDDYEGEEGYEDHYVVRGAPGSEITVRAQSEDFDTYLQLGVWRDGELDVLQEDDDGGSGTNSRLFAELDEDEEYHIVVRAYEGEGGGAYRLRVLRGDQTDEWDDSDGDEEWDEPLPDELGDPDFSGMGADLDDDEAVETDTMVYAPYDADSVVVLDTSGQDGSGEMVWTLESVVLDEPVEGVLEEGQPQTGDGAYFREFSFSADAGERLRVRASSPDFDAYLLVGTGSGDDFEPIAQDDDSGPDLDAELAWTFRRSGTYTIRVTSAVPGQTGAFTLWLRPDR